MVYNTAEYCSPVWIKSVHYKTVDIKLDYARACPVNQPQMIITPVFSNTIHITENVTEIVGEKRKKDRRDKKYRLD